MGRPIAIPRILAISWWSLLWISILEGVLRSTFHLHSLEWLNSVAIWMLVQAVWLKRAEPESKAIYWYAAADLLGLGLALAEHKMTMTNWTEGLISLAIFVIVTYATFKFKWEMEYHFNETDPVGLKLSGWMTLFFSYLYFQYHLHEIYLRKDREPLIDYAR
jgi:hypothetical protein